MPDTSTRPHLWRLAFLALGVVLVTGTVHAQPLAEAPHTETSLVIVQDSPDVAYRLPGGAPAIRFAPEADGETSTGYRTAAVTVIGGLGAAVGGSLVVVGAALAESATASGEDTSLPLGAYLALGALGSTAGTAVLVGAFGEDRADYDGIIPYPGIHPGDGWIALRGAAVGLLPGLAATGLAYAVGGEDAAFVTSLVAIPISQGLGAAISINLDRR